MTAISEASPRLRDRLGQLRDLVPGLTLSAVVAIAASSLALRYHAPVMLFALLIGMTLAFLAEDTRLRPGLEFASSSVLKIAVALLGLTISVTTLASLGLMAFLSVAGLLCATMALGIWLGLRAGWSRELAIVSAGAVAICGASAALALTALMPADRIRRADVLSVILVATTLSTLAMAFYPVIAHLLGFTDVQTGFLLGASIHDVAQVVGAGYSVSETAGDTATVVKMMRVALLPVVLITMALWVTPKGEAKRFRLPWFVWLFAAFFILSSGLALPDLLTDGAKTLTRLLLVVAMASIGLLSNLREMARTGRPIFRVLGTTSLFLFVAAVLVQEGFRAM